MPDAAKGYNPPPVEALESPKPSRPAPVPAPLAPQDAPTALDKLLKDPTALASIPIATVTELHRIHRVEIEDRRMLEFGIAFKRAQGRLAQVNIPKLSKGDRDSRFAKTEQICKVLDPVLVEEGFTWSFSDQDSTLPGHVKVVMLLRHGGHAEHHAYNSPAWDGKGARGGAVMTPLQASGAMRTYAERRLRMGVFGLHLVDDDNDGADPPRTEPISEDQAHDMRVLIEGKWSADRQPVVIRRLLAILQVSTIEEIPAGRYVEGMSMLERKM